MRLIMDFVPWVEHPEYFIRECPDDARDNSAGFVPIEGRVYVYGRNPYFHIDRASGALHLTPAIRQTVPQSGAVRRLLPSKLARSAISLRVDTSGHIQQRGLIQ